MTSNSSEEQFHPTSGRIGGVVGIVLAAVIAGAGLVNRDAGYALWAYPACGLLALVSWSMLLRPRVSVADGHLRLRQSFSTQALPLAAVRGVAVGRVLEVRVGGKRYVSAAIGRTPRAALRDRAQPAEAIGKRSYADFVERRINEHVEAARRTVSDADPGEVRRTWAWPEIVATAGCAVVLVVTLLA